jgi:hypothetical protein
VLFLVTNFFVFLIIGVPVGALAIALAFVPINNRPFSYFLEAMFNYFSKHRLYIWKQERDITYKHSFLPQQQTNERVVPISTVRPGEQSSVMSLARRLELEALQKNES